MILWIIQLNFVLYGEGLSKQWLPYPINICWFFHIQCSWWFSNRNFFNSQIFKSKCIFFFSKRVFHWRILQYFLHISRKLMHVIGSSLGCRVPYFLCLQQITDLKKENFNLKLRIYFMEERMQQRLGDGDDVLKIVRF